MRFYHALTYCGIQIHSDFNLELQSLEHHRLLFNLIFCYNLNSALLMCQWTISFYLALAP